MLVETVQDVRGTRVVLRAVDAPRGGVVLISEVWGVDAVLRTYADRLNDEGYTVAMPDVWAPRGGPPPLDGPDAIRDAVASLHDGQVVADVMAARDVLPTEPRFALGFCMGGLYARMAGAMVPGLAGVVEFYGRLVYPQITANKPVQPLDLTPGLACPYQGHFGEDDPVAPPHHVADLEARLQRTGRPAQVFRYPGVGHAFMNPTRPSWNAAAAALAWQRAVRFLDELSG